MSGAPLLAGAAGVLAAAAIVELTALRGGGAASGGGKGDSSGGGSGAASGGGNGDGSGGGRSGPLAARLALALAALARLGRRRAPVAPQDLAARVDAAGAPLGLGVAEVMALKCGAAVAGGLLALATGALAPGRLGIVALLAGPAVGFVLPDLLLRRIANRRAEAFALELADVAELLRVAVDAGLTPMRALAEVGRRHPGLLAAELRAVAARVELGVPRTEVLGRLVARAPVGGVHALVAALGRAERHGSPLGPALAALAEEARSERTRRVRDRAARAAPKIQLVVALLLVPAVLLMVAASLAASLL